MLTEAPRKRGDARERVLQLAEAAVLDKGFAATSIEELIAGAGITKSGFFYHFRDKTELARVLLERYIARENALFDDLFRRADALNEDPLHGFLVALKMLAEMLSDLPNGHPGCLIASYCYQDRIFDQQVRELNAEAVRAWRRRFRERLDTIAAGYPPRVAVDLDDLADMLSAVVDGGIILSKALKDKDALPRQVMLYRAFVRAVFAG
ncbi:MAG: TetR/AcrR family transcriptional regulator [Hyphomicrobium sp.]|uniref:TetR/AcrR family transcriptional regulator n=1 Tax=Hyphomicrobium sp. TaxID=82 RepID=UPI003D11BD87